MILNHHPAKALAWLSKHVDDATLTSSKRQKNGGSLLLSDLLTLKLSKRKPADMGDALPPLDPAEVFRLLDAPKDLADFGDRQRTEPGKVYVHQVLRALAGFKISSKYTEPWIGKVRALTRHPHPQIRQAAYLTFTHFADDLDPKDPAVDEFRKVMDDPKQTPAIREAALMAFASFSHPQVFVRLHEIALDTKHPGWRGAVSGIYFHISEFTYEHLGKIDRDKLSAANAEHLDYCRKSLKKSLDDPQRRREASYWLVSNWVERTAFAEHVKSPLAKTLAPWTRSFLKNHPDKLANMLMELHNTYAPRHAVADSRGLTRRVRELVIEILIERNEEKQAHQ
jgi:hypothetical protein